jgi:hypothetical protein
MKTDQAEAGTLNSGVAATNGEAADAGRRTVPAMRITPLVRRSPAGGRRHPKRRPCREFRLAGVRPTLPPVRPELLDLAT